MYRFLDQPVARLAPMQRFLLEAARGWATAVAAQDCPVRALAPRFDPIELDEQLHHFHLLMIVLQRDALWQLRLAPPGQDRIDDDEATLLELFDAAARNEDACRRLAGALMRDPEGARVVAMAAAYVARCVTAALDGRSARA